MSWSPLLSDKEGPCYLNRSFPLKQSQKKGRHLHSRSPCAIASFSTGWLPQCVGQTEVKVPSVAPPPVSQVSLVMQTLETECLRLPVYSYGLRYVPRVRTRVMDCIVQNRKCLCCVKVATDYCPRLHPLTSCTPCCYPYRIYACCWSPPSLRSMVGLHAWCLLWRELCRGPSEPQGYELELLSFREGNSGSVWLSVCLGDLGLLMHSVFLEPLEG